jgi:HK97 gp10 family phage protein
MIPTRTFDDLTSFVLHLGAAEVALRTSEYRALDKAAQLIEKSAKAEIGVYQPEVGPFPAWAPLAESTVEDRVRKGYTPNDPELRSGALRESISREVSGREAVVGSDSEVMVYQEMGTSKMPPRPILGPAAFKNKKQIARIIGAHAVAAILFGKVTAGGLEYFYDEK